MSETTERKLFDVPVEEVVTAAACTYCGVGVGDDCREFRHAAFHKALHVHAQRWYDFWNATHDEQRPVTQARWAIR